MLRIAPIVAPGQADLAGAGKAGQVIDMPRGLIVDHAFAKPDDTARPQVALQQLLYLRPAQGRIALEQTLLRDQHRTLAIDMDGAALVDERRAVAVVTGQFEHL